MTIKDLYNALEKAIDSGEATCETELAISEYDSGRWGSVNKVYVENGKLRIEEEF